MEGAKKWLLVLLVSAVLLTQSGCGIFGLMLNGTRQTVFIDTSPSGATITVEGQTAKSPTQFNLSRRRNYTVQIEKEGYEPSLAYINKEVDPLVLFLDYFIWPFLWGTAWDLEPERIYVNLTPKRQ